MAHALLQAPLGTDLRRGGSRVEMDITREDRAIRGHVHLARACEPSRPHAQEPAALMTTNRMAVKPMAGVHGRFGGGAHAPWVKTLCDQQWMGWDTAYFGAIREDKTKVESPINWPQHGVAVEEQRGPNPGHEKCPLQGIFRQPTFVSHLKAVSTQRGFWYILIANGLQTMAYIGMSGYLAAYLIQSYGMDAGDTALPLSLAGLGVIAGSLVGGRVADRSDRASVLACTFLGGGFAAALVFMIPFSPWLTVVLAFAVSGLLLLAWPVVAVMLTDLAGDSRATATGLFAVSNQMGVLGGASLGGVMLSLGHFPFVGIFCLAMAALAAGIMRYKVRGTEEAHQRSTIS